MPTFTSTAYRLPAASPNGDSYDQRMLQAGDEFAGYTILRLLGAGGMGEVYLAQHPRLERQDALKVLSPRLSADRDFAQRFRREANLTASLWHPHIIGVHDAGEEDSRLWLSMDYADGIDAARLLKQHPSGVPVADAVDIAAAVAEALDFAHQRGLLHRDVKPANILITTPDIGTRRIILADFGIARQTDDISGLTATNMTLGTVNYAAPEQLMGGAIDGRADQYALAATIYHLLVGSPVFDHTNPAVVISRHLNAAPPLLSQARPDLSALDDLFLRALAKDPAARYADCAEFAESLHRAAGWTRTVLAPVPPSTPSRTPAPIAAAQAPTQASAVPTAALNPPNSRISRRGLVITAAASAAVVALVVTLVTITGLRDTADSSPTSTADTSAGTSSSRQSPGPVTAPILLPPQIAETGRIVVGTNVPYAPAEFRTSDGTLSGFDVDLIHAVAAELGVTAEIREFDFSRIIPALLAGEIDLGMAAMTDTKERERDVDMVNYFSAGTQWAQQSGTPAINPNEACGLRVAVQNTTTQQTDELPARSRACVNSGKPALQILPFYGQDEAFNAVVIGDADAVSAESPVTGYAIKRSSGRLVSAGDMVDVAPYGWPVAKGSSLAPALQQALQRMIDNGSYTRLLTSWGVERGALQSATINQGVG